MAVDVVVTDQSASVRLPGGAELSISTGESNPSKVQAAKALVTQANAAIAPIVPIFNIIDAILSVKGALEAIPDALGPPPDPSKISGALEDVAKKVGKLASLIPQLSGPILVIDTIDALIMALSGIIEQLETIALQEQKITAASAIVGLPGNSSLQIAIDCATDIAAAQKAGINQGTQPLNKLINVANIVLALFGGAEIPPLDDLPDDTTVAIASLQATVDLLQTLRDGIPVP